MLARELVEENGGPQGRVWSSLLVVDGEEGREAVSRVLLQTGERKTQLMDKGVADLVAEDELVRPHGQDVGVEVLARNRLRSTFVAVDVCDGLRQKGASRGDEVRRPKNRPAVHFRGRVIDPFGHFVADSDLDVVGQRHRLARPVGEALEGARVPHELHGVAVLGLDACVVVHDLHPTVTACHSPAGVLVAGAGREPYNGCDKGNSKDMLSHVGAACTRKCAGDHVHHWSVCDEPSARCYYDSAFWHITPIPDVLS